MTSITMPQLGESVAEGTIGKWLKGTGERIERDEPLVEVITDKVTAEIPSPVAGVVEQIVVEEGQTVPVGREIAVITEAGASASAAAPAAEQPGGVAGMAAGEAEGPASPTAVAAGPASVPSPPHPTPPIGEAEAGEADGERRRASPLVRRLAREHNVDLSQVRGSGAGGRVTKDDILAFVESRGAAPSRTP